MANERRSETPVRDSTVRREISLSVILQSLILAAIIGSVTVLISIKEQLAVYASELRIVQITIKDHEGRIRVIELEQARRGG